MTVRRTPYRRQPILTVVSAFFLIASMAGIAAAVSLPPGGTFGDDDGSVHEADIEALAAAGITQGCNPPTNDRFCPDNAVTRAQMATFLTRALTLPPAASSFTDTASSVHQADIGALAAAGITLGCSPPTNDRFCPDNAVTRAQMATFLTRALGLDPIEPPELVTFGPGVHRVGIDIPSGIYRNEGDRASCYWERLSGFGGTSDDRITNGFDDVRQIVEIEASDVGFSADADCGLWSNDLSSTKDPIAPFTGGFWLVPEEVQPGLWRNQPDDTGCYWERLSGFSGESEDRVANDFISGMENVIVEIGPTDRGFYADSDCGTWMLLP